MKSSDDVVAKEEIENSKTEDDDHETNQVLLFVEEQEVLGLMAVISSTIQAQTENLSLKQAASYSDDDNDNLSVPLHRLRTIFDKYLECPTLLDQSLETLIATLSAPIRNIFHSWEDRMNLHPLRRDVSDTDNSTTCDFLVDIVPFVDSVRYHLSMIYYLCKVRGRKYIQRFLPHHVSDVMPVWMALQTILNFQKLLSSNHNKVRDVTLGTPSVPEKKPEEIAPLWETIYVLWIWMSTLSLVPFDSNRFASLLSNVSVEMDDVGTSDIPFTVQLVETCQRHLHETGPIRHVVSVCLSSWLSRPDNVTNQQPLSIFITRSTTAIVACICTGHNNSFDSFHIMGLLQTITTILKISSIPREDLLQQILPLWEPLLQLSQRSTNDILLQKLLVKWWTRISCTLLPPRLASWRYQRGKRFLFQSQQDDTQKTMMKTMPQDIVHKKIMRKEDHVNVEVDWMVPDEVEYAMGQIIAALSNASTIVRWSAAKGVGRITERLPSLCADDVLDAILFLFHDTCNDRCWHGACLALAELARRGLLLPQRLHEVIPFLIQAVHYDRRRGTVHVGAHVRDAACYTYWAFARAYDPKILQPFLADMTRAIVLTSLFDREVNCRRSASSAFQEAVGRQGATNFPHGIEILTAADYFSLGNRTNAYLSIAVQIANYDELRIPIIQHLSASKLLHWDIHIRTLSSKTLYKLTSLDPKYMCDVVIPTLLEHCLDEKDLFTRHGAVLGVAEIVLALSENENLNYLPSNVEELLTDLVPTIERKRLYRGRGGEIMRSAVCRLMECICLSRIPLSVKGQVRLLDSIESNIPHPTEAIQEDACRALEALMVSYFPVGTAGPSPRLQQRVVNKFIETIRTTENPAVARGYALALGHLPPKLICPSMDVLTSILDCLIQASRHNTLIGGENDAETRRNSLRSLVRISRQILHSSHQMDSQDDTTVCTVVRMDKCIFERVCTTFLSAMDDYRTDRRGDVGSWCRLVGMEGITELILAVASDERKKSKWIVSDVLVTTIVGGILKQLAEKLDYVRHRAGACIQELVSSPQLFNIMASHSELVIALHRSQSTVQSAESRWMNPSHTFALVMNVILLTNTTIYFECIVTGIVSSIGGLTEDVYKYSSSSLLQFMKQSSSERKEQVLMYLLQLLQQRNNRLVQPILKTMDLLVTHGYCQDVVVHQAKLERNCFMEQSILCLQHEAKISTNVPRLLLVIDVSVSLLTSFLSCHEYHNSSVRERKRLLTLLCSTLTHPFPRVRTYVAEQMYTYLLENDNIENHTENECHNISTSNSHDKNDAIQKLLLNTLWSNDLEDVMVLLQPVMIQITKEFGIEGEF